MAWGRSTGARRRGLTASCDARLGANHGAWLADQCGTSDCASMLPTDDFLPLPELKPPAGRRRVRSRVGTVTWEPPDPGSLSGQLRFQSHSQTHHLIPDTAIPAIEAHAHVHAHAHHLQSETPAHPRTLPRTSPDPPTLGVQHPPSAPGHRCEYPPLAGLHEQLTAAMTAGWKRSTGSLADRCRYACSAAGTVVCTYAHTYTLNHNDPIA
ncbi:hypothetical protein OIDMADRAFT_174159 [Oidiodendron maius Zn]|uniref:Uncharacterized protein n=1 Tax=Oidiodendron maius (strain Zn) TaxID=913774 RepID=A0A0C3HG42_OIDMZ|nr:hypothetical protein OIDMADRAFT_174159 [Oidiodendron maius Zn]